MTLNDARNAYREAAVRSATQVQLVVMMYDLLVEDIRRAIKTLSPDDPEKRCDEIKHCLAVLEQLQGTLDIKKGGDAARNMDRLYAIVRGKLLEAHMKHSEPLFRAQLTLLSELRQAWQLSQSQMREDTSIPQVSSAPFSEAGADRNISQWNA